jgi:hypothetical protein
MINRHLVGMSGKLERVHEGPSCDRPQQEDGSWNDPVVRPVKSAGWVYEIEPSKYGYRANQVIDLTGFTGWLDLSPFFNWGDQDSGLFVRCENGVIVEVRDGAGDCTPVPLKDEGCFDWGA